VCIGLRKKVSEVKQAGYLEAFVQAIFNTLIEVTHLTSPHMELE
jgi:phosphoglucomutase